MLELLKLVFKFCLDRSSVRECQTGKVLTPDTDTKEEEPEYTCWVPLLLAGPDHGQCELSH